MKTRRFKFLFWLIYDNIQYHIYAYSGCHAYQILIRHLVDTGVPLNSINTKDFFCSQLDTTFLK